MDAKDSPTEKEAAPEVSGGTAQEKVNVEGLATATRLPRPPRRKLTMRLNKGRES